MGKTFDTLSTGKSKLDGVIMSDILSPITRVEAPFIRVEIGGYSFGVYESSSGGNGATGLYSYKLAKYPNYVLSVNITKINGTVNMYKLRISYPVTQTDDPNFFEKLFSRISKTRKISISYGDALLPNYVYRDEEAIITELTSAIDLRSSVINYDVSAVSSDNLTLSGSYNFPVVTTKPSDEIKKILFSDKYKVNNVLTGLRNKSKILMNNIIASDDKVVTIPAQMGVNILERLNFLTQNMVSYDTSNTSGKSNGVYVMSVVDDTLNNYGGSYVSVSKVAYTASEISTICTYLIDIGHPTANVIESFSFSDNGGWSILYDYQQEARTNDTVKRINDKGELIDDYLPLIAGSTYNVYTSDKTWWTKVTEFPVQATIKIKGIIKPAILMSYLKVNVWFYGRKHISSGYYLITSQEDEINSNGYWTTMNLTRVAEDGEEGF